MSDYYKYELNRVLNDANLKIVVSGDGARTKYLNLNKESLAALREFLDLFEKRLTMQYVISTEYLGVFKDFDNDQVEELENYLEEVQENCNEADNDLFMQVMAGLENKNSFVVLPVNQDDITIDFKYLEDE